jgi:hypothetical protein
MNSEPPSIYFTDETKKELNILECWCELESKNVFVDYSAFDDYIRYLDKIGRLE